MMYNALALDLVRTERASLTRAGSRFARHSGDVVPGPAATSTAPHQGRRHRLLHRLHAAA
jgi:hypothetical protein